MNCNGIGNHYLPQHIRGLPLGRSFLPAFPRHTDRRRTYLNLCLYFSALLLLHWCERKGQNRRLPVINRDIRYINRIKPICLRLNIIADKRRSQKILIQGKPLVHCFQWNTPRLSVLIRPHLINRVLFIVQHRDQNIPQRNCIVGSPCLHSYKADSHNSSFSFSISDIQI